MHRLPLLPKEIFLVLISVGAWGSVVVKALLVGRSRDRFPVLSLEIFSVATNRTMCPEFDSASKNEYQGFLLW